MMASKSHPEDLRAMPEFWQSSGYRLVEVDAERRLRLTDDFLRAFLLRPEILPVAESCAAELALHEALLAKPRLRLLESRLAELADPDARDNYRTLLLFRDRLLVQPNLEAAYLDLVRRGGAGVPPCSSISWRTSSSATSSPTDPIRSACAPPSSCFASRRSRSRMAG